MMFCFVYASDCHEKRLTITALAWNPNGTNELSFCDNHGNLGVMENLLPSDIDESEVSVVSVVVVLCELLCYRRKKQRYKSSLLLTIYLVRQVRGGTVVVAALLLPQYSL